MAPLEGPCGKVPQLPMTVISLTHAWLSLPVCSHYAFHRACATGHPPCTSAFISGFGLGGERPQSVMSYARKIPLLKGNTISTEGIVKTL